MAKRRFRKPPIYLLRREEELLREHLSNDRQIKMALAIAHNVSEATIHYWLHPKSRERTLKYAQRYMRTHKRKWRENQKKYRSRSKYISKKRIYERIYKRITRHLDYYFQDYAFKEKGKHIELEAFNKYLENKKGIYLQPKTIEKILQDFEEKFGQMPIVQVSSGNYVLNRNYYKNKAVASVRGNCFKDRKRWSLGILASLLGKNDPETQTVQNEIARFFIESGRYKINYNAAKKYKKIKPLIYANTPDFRESFSSRERGDSIIRRIELERKDVGNIIENRISDIIGDGEGLILYFMGIIKPRISWKEREIRQYFTKKLVKKLKKPLAEIKKDDFIKNGLGGLLARYQASVYLALKEAGYEILPWERNMAPLNFWKDKENRTNATKWLVKKLKKKAYKINAEDFSTNNLGGLLEHYSGSPYRAFREAGYRMQPWEMENVPLCFWNNKKNRINATRWLVKKLKKPVTKIDHHDFIKNLGDMLNCSKYSLYEILREAGYDILPWEMKYVPSKFWKYKTNRTNATKWLVKKLKKKAYKINAEDFSTNNLGGLLEHYSGSPYRAFREAGYRMQPWERNMAPLNFWKDKENRINATKWLVKKLRKPVKEITWKDFYTYIRGLLRSVNYTPYDALKEAGYTILPWEMEMQNIPPGILNKKENRIQATKWLVKRIKKPITSITVRDFISNNLGCLVKNYYKGSPFLALKEAGYVNHSSEMKNRPLIYS